MNQSVQCINDTCELKENCARHKLNAIHFSSNIWESSAYFEPDSTYDCRWFIDLNKNESDFDKNKNIIC